MYISVMALVFSCGFFCSGLHSTFSVAVDSYFAISCLRFSFLLPGLVYDYLLAGTCPVGPAVGLSISGFSSFSQAVFG